MRLFAKLLVLWDVLAYMVDVILTCTTRHWKFSPCRLLYAVACGIINANNAGYRIFPVSSLEQYPTRRIFYLLTLLADGLN